MKNQFQVLKEIAADLGIEIKTAKLGDGHKQGVHKLYPSLEDLHDALDVAERDQFKTIYIHNAYTWPRS